ncbi:2-keto-4-pentenoate hydratase/2-oxohepta-3-ene-1,7-dioic acid hydratase in catechol pathway [Agromyces flavus]|uniref:2-keto-4-pentenoate hydratase/2-oxohepta-3-ene-1,7-dioic acid hydratase (Catechol pathway) n=1 Tax=Agromyces flavus TaxID=589382 RepID=A0A1H1W8Z2_9MICO|nr:fumarylacetoacetate hydrolase family protein [Agromyces flavus]MCP2366114.1 2-keto-4-pentenoate hydratase/2-oxohepta-3-ene-1,7-dioic acid hydratase in catechol pathway [Agromyces flavus]GGI44028.1 2-hydroxyhepta-2,4-diene-1,7-dioate isomerase [Agromyces flavus]SDS93583.1 2-keto-4-pentenoate hydratase/2-oxohepta-3-ene-1,7-dioic acid hydratase (catechol pathway) [Agromyces flavus]
MTAPFTLARLGTAGREVPVVRVGDRVLDARGVTADYDAGFFADDGIARLGSALDTLPEFRGDGTRVGAPIARPGKIVCIGLNYRDHAEETGAALPDEPVIFMKDPSTLVGPFDDVLIPRGSEKTDWEVELGVVIGTTARYLDSPDEALKHVAGYAVSHDVSERGFQLERGGQWDKGKSCETFNPFGPDLVPADQVADPQRLGLRLWVNGELRQDGSTENMLFSIAHVIWYLSQFMVLHPGDVINTGTPAGVALGLPGNPYLRAGDTVELEIDGLGRASQRMVQA